MHGISVIHFLCHYIHAVHQHIVINEIIQRTCLICTQSVGTYFVLKKYKIREKGVNCKRAFLSTHTCVLTHLINVLQNLQPLFMLRYVLSLLVRSISVMWAYPAYLN